MTGEQTEVIEHAARQGRDPRWRRFVTAVLAALALAVAVGIVALVILYGNTSSLRGQVTVLSGQQAEAARVAQQLAGQLHANGLTPVVQPPTPIQGPPGQNGVNGRSITGTSIAGGHLVVSYSDGRTQDVGQVVGTVGAAGRGITATAVVAGNLIVSFSDGTTTDLGTVTGPKGQQGTSVVSVTVSSDFHLIVAYSDGTTADAGSLPPGPKGDPGQNGVNGQPPAGWTATFSDGSTQTCSRAPNFDASNPQYTCTVTAPSTTTSPPTTGLLGIHH